MVGQRQSQGEVNLKDYCYIESRNPNTEIPGPDLECGLEVYMLQLRNAIMTALHSGNVAPGQAETISKLQYQMTKTLHVLVSCQRGI